MLYTYWAREYIRLHTYWVRGGTGTGTLGCTGAHTGSAGTLGLTYWVKRYIRMYSVHILGQGDKLACTPSHILVRGYTRLYAYWVGRTTLDCTHTRNYSPL